MKVRNTITFIISKNYGRPLSWSIPVWRAYLGGAAVAVVLVAMTSFSALYLFTHQRIQQLESNTRELRKERDALKDQIFSANQEAFDRKTALFAALPRNNDGLEPQSPVLDGNSDEEFYEPPFRVTSYTARVRRRSVEISFRLHNQGPPDNNRGGILFIVLENSDQSPSHFIASPGVNTNAEGFPQTYKYGARFLRVRTTVTLRRRFKRASPDEFFTHVTVFVFSVRGGLILKERFKLEKDLFLRGQPATQTYKLTNL